MRRRLATLLLALLTAVTAVAPAHASGSVSGDVAPDRISWPPRRFAACGAVGDGTLYAYGGRGDDGSTHHGDLWALDLGNARRTRPAWRLATGPGAPAAPPAVRSCAATWDPLGGRLIVFGGWNGATHDGGLRAFDPATGQWELLCDVTSCGAGPGPRRASQIVVDPGRRRLLLFAGTSGAYFDDLWALPLVGGTWTRLPSGPISRGGHAMAIDPAGDGLWLFGGTRPGSDLDDLWRLDLATDTWGQRSPSCPEGCPTPRSGATLVSDAGADRLLLYGGWESSSNIYRRETWALQDLDGTAAWERIVPDSESPQARFFPVAGYDAAAQRMVIFGGGAFGSAYRDAFGLAVPPDGSPPRWHTLSPTTPLTARDQVSVVLDDGLLTAFGGFGSGTFPGTFGAGTHLADTWQRPLRRKAGWRLATPVDESTVPIAREGAASALDRRHDRMLLFGGLQGDTTLADVWIADLSRPGEPRWQQLCSPTSCGDGPSARWGAHAVHDPDGERLVVFGGMDDNGVTTNDVWALDLTRVPTWRELTPAGPRPAARWSAASGYDPIGRRLVVFGGQTGPDATGAGLQDTWALTLDGEPHWTPLAITGPRPAPRRSAAAAVRTTAAASELVVASGLTVAGGIHHNDVWSLDLGEDDAQWVLLAADQPAAGPAPRRSATAAYDSCTDHLLVVFGRDAERFFDDTWTFDLAERAWRRLPG
jgi:hypothetical protein